MTELLWALLIMFICILFTWLGVGALCAAEIVKQCMPIITPFLI